MPTTALITGASSGIGLELARLHASKEGDLILVARRKELLLKIKSILELRYNVFVKVIEKDLSQKNAAREIYEEVKSANIDVDYLINNAGFGGYGKFHEREWAKDDAMISVNIKALAALTRFFLPDMVKKNRGKILNVASVSGFLPGPLQAVYYATKAFVVSFSQAIAEEVSDTKITVTVLCPGATESEFAETSNLDDTNIFKKKATPASEVALYGYKAMLKGRRIAVNEKSLKLMVDYVIPFLPRKILAKLSRQSMEKS